MLRWVIRDDAQTFPLEKLEALLDFQGPADLAAWLAANSNNPA
ncbi:MAG: hypothetical protein R6W06_02480 [Prochlorococcaceae cyanobacterium]